jgi:hypothetical protein
MIALAVAATSALSCSPPKSNKAETYGMGYSYAEGLDLSKEKFTEWQTSVESQFGQDNIGPDHFKAYLEGRNNGGLDELRSVIKPFPRDKYETYDVRAGLTSSEFYDRGTKNQRNGYKRIALQVFIDGSGVARYQVVWVKPRKAPDAPAVSPAQ